MDPIYTHEQIQVAWSQYTKDHCWKITKRGGQKAVRMQAPDVTAEGLVACRMVKARDAIGFPKYLEITRG